jgi:hypothetical protein
MTKCGHFWEENQNPSNGYEIFRSIKGKTRGVRIRK